MGIVDNRGFGERLRAFRSRKGLTLRDLAKVTRRSISLLSQIETGKVTPSFATMRIVSDALSVPLSRMITDGDADET
jgi:transcriptional regulator with XRE-family HTH domain